MQQAAHRRVRAAAAARRHGQRPYHSHDARGRRTCRATARATAGPKVHSWVSQRSRAAARASRSTCRCVRIEISSPACRRTATVDWSVRGSCAFCNAAPQHHSSTAAQQPRQHSSAACDVQRRCTGTRTCTSACPFSCTFVVMRPARCCGIPERTNAALTSVNVCTSSLCRKSW